ncbi:hypothetical protein P378_14485 [Desulforamulus profundi]|uniref:Uncharacterized protein n=2 Tax=Desulforamulus profundi TaxID=1383067 RepID=A0A2C6M660_9FIRM|nr:hypothetical protein P378_14485 [Desulforamulus profundi]
MGIQLPDKIVIYAIEAMDTLTFSETLSPPVAGAVPRAVQAIRNDIRSR